MACELMNLVVNHAQLTEKWQSQVHSSEKKKPRVPKRASLGLSRPGASAYGTAPQCRERSLVLRAGGDGEGVCALCVCFNLSGALRQCSIWKSSRLRKT